MKRIAIAALCIFALSGGVASAGKLITGKQIKNGTIQAVDLSAKTKRALKGNVGPAGPQGAPGPQGATGAQGARGADGASPEIVAADGPIVSLCAEDPGGTGCLVGASVATCPAGSVPTGGGWESGAKPALTATVAYNSTTADGRGWMVAMANNGGAGAPEIEFFAVVRCVKGSATAAASAASGAESKADVLSALRTALKP